MKKIISIVLCAVMLMSILSVSAFAAEVPDAGDDLGEFGQKHFYIGDEVETPPDIDGVVSEGEYTLEITGLNTADDAIDDRFFLIDHCDSEFINIYAAQDFDFIYLAVEVQDPEFVHRDGVSFVLGMKENIDSALMFATNFNDIPDDTPMTIDFFELSKSEEDPSNPYAMGEVVEYPSSDAYTYVAAKGISYDETTQIATYELAFSRMMLEEYAGDLLDQIYFRVIVRMLDKNGEVGTIWFGFRGDSSELRTKHHAYLSRFPHVLHFADGDGDETYVPKADEKDNTGLPQIDLKNKVATAPVLDGVINEGEYTNTYGADVGSGDDMWGFIDGEQQMIRAVDAPYAKGLRGASWSLANDGEFLYIATSIKTSGAAPMAQFFIMKRQDNISYPIATISADGTVSKGNEAWSFAEVKTANDGENYVFEAKIAIDDITDDPSTIYFMARAYLNDSFLFFGLNEDPLGGVCGFRTALDESKAPVTEAPETNAPETNAPETNAPETNAPETNAPETNAPETNAPETEAPKAEGGCGASVAAVAVALVATLGTCAVFVTKKNR